LRDPFVSVIMPVRNEAAFIALSLNAVLHQDYPRQRMEILLADGASEDDTLAIVRSLPGAARVRIIHNPRRTQAAGMNEALRQARGDVIVRVDGHTVIAPDYIRQCVIALDETGAHNVGGAMLPVGVTPQGKAIAAATTSAFAVPTAFHTDRTGRFTDTVYMGAWPRQALERAGGFDERLTANEDYELNYRIRQSGGRIYLAPAIRSHYFGRQTLPALARQYFRYGRAKTATLRKAPASLRPRQLVAPAFVGVLIGGAPLSLVISLALVVWLGILLAYLTLNLGFSAHVARRAGFHVFWRLPAIFATIHVAWGLGFWVGLLAGPARPPFVAREPSAAAAVAGSATVEARRRARAGAS
jgi:succinoglycan biosynthesis protein ExoA